MMPGMPGAKMRRWLPRGFDPNAKVGPPGGRLQFPYVAKSAQWNSRLLPQGSGGLVSEKSSALLQGSAPPVRHPSIDSGVAPIRPAPPQAAVPVPKKSVASATSGIKPEELKRKTLSLLEEYFNIRMVDEALQCVEELKSPAYHSEIVKEAINLGLEKNPPLVDPIVKFLEHMLAKNVFSPRDIGTGCLLYGSIIDDIAIDLPKAPNNFGENIGKLILAKGTDFSVVTKVLKKVEDEMFRKPIFDAAVRVVGAHLDKDFWKRKLQMSKNVRVFFNCRSFFGLISILLLGKIHCNSQLPDNFPLLNFVCTF
ncbi:hypothetical protein RND81_07G076700 [Saponaria officinalis]|uniref:MI domain-containing protein n=1 Tax=Saponaria officinalis TaxID=3572 RepID=A0AAW1JP71_SAPOF